MFDDRASNPTFCNGHKNGNTDDKAVSIKARPAPKKCEAAQSSGARKTRRTDFDMMTSLRGQLARAMKPAKLAEDDLSSDTILSFASRVLKLLVRYSQKTPTTKKKASNLAKNLGSKLTIITITSRHTSKFATTVEQMIDKIIDVVHEIANRFQAIEDSGKTILAIDSDVEIDVRALRKDIASFAIKSTTTIQARGFFRRPVFSELCEMATRANLF